VRNVAYRAKQVHSTPTVTRQEPYIEPHERCYGEGEVVPVHAIQANGVEV